MQQVAALDDVPIDKRLEVYTKLHNRSQGIDVKGVRQSAENELLMLAQGRATGDWHSYRFELEADEPHRVLRVQIDPLEASEAEALMGG